MPLFFKQELDEESRLAIWKIEEDEDFFLQKVFLQRSITHPHKRLQHLAGRYLLPYLFPDFPVALIQIADTLKPFLENEAYHFSISHGGDYAAAIVSKSKRVGVDVELVSEKVQKVQHKFLSDEEMERVKEDEVPAVPNEHLSATNFSNELLTLLWSCKEAVFKWYGNGEIDFKEHIEVQKIKQMPDQTFQTSICFQKKEPQFLVLHSQKFSIKQPFPNHKLILTYLLA